MTTHAEITLIAGIPGTGKTEFSKWFAQQTDALYLEFDELFRTMATPHPSPWITTLNTKGVSGLLQELRRLDRPVVIEWGFHPDNLPAIQQLKALGAELWWFDGNREAARKSFAQAKGPQSLPAFDAQLARIEAAWERIAPVFDSRILNVVAAGPKHSSGREIMAKIMRLQGRR